MNTTFRDTVTIAAALLLAVVAGCERQTRPLNVLMIGVDTLRPDHLGCYGYDRETSSEIDRLAGRGVLFENVVSQSPWTLPSFASIFTSLYPTQHGASALKTQLRTDHPTLAMMLLKRGYSTAGIINAPFLRPEFKLDRGFEYYDYKPPFAGRRADGTTEDALAWIDAHIDEPFFVFAHYFDPHIPYDPPEPYDNMFYPGYAGELATPLDFNQFPRARATNFETMKSLSPEDWDYMRALYDGEIAFTDRAVGELLDGLEERGLEDKTLVVFLSDHGEEFFEHEGFEHGHTLYNEVIKAPLLMSLPGQLPEGSRVTEHVRLIDVAPTILDFLDLEPTAHMEGASLKPMITGDGEVNAPEASLLPVGIGYSESMLYGAERKCIFAYPWKYTYELMSGNHTLVNLLADPGETEDVAPANPDALAPVDELLARTMFRMSETWYIEISGDGEEHVFDIEVNSRGGPRTGSIYIACMVGSDGRMVDLRSIADARVGPGGISVRNLKLSSNATIAFKVEPGNASLVVDTKIDGRASIEAINLGATFEHPETIPFTLHKRAGRRASREPSSERPEGPYFLIWKSRNSLSEPAVFEFDESITNELRSVGYLQ